MTSDTPSVSTVITYLRGLHDRISIALEAADGTGRFRRDTWQRSEGGGGGGESRVLREGSVFEQAGINYSDVRGRTLPPAATAQRPQLAGPPFRAMGLSVVVHPANPSPPPSHANVRYVSAGEAEPVGW